MTLVVANSFVSDGTMNDRANPTDPVIIANRETWLKSHGIRIEDAVRVKIVYDEPEQNYCRYREVTNADKGAGMYDGDTSAADGLVTTEKGLALFLPIADCVGTTLYDEERGVLMLSHLGRHSLEQDGGFHSVKYLHDTYGVEPTNLRVWLSATVNKEAYKIYKLDNVGMKEAVYEQLQRAGVKPTQIVDCEDDTATDPRYYSQSEFLKGNKPEDGRFAVVAVMTED